MKGTIRDIKKSVLDALWDEDAVVMLTIVLLGATLGACVMGLGTSQLTVGVTVTRLGDDVLGLVSGLFGRGAVATVSLTLTALGVGFAYVALTVAAIYPLSWATIRLARLAVTRMGTVAADQGGFTLVELSLSLIIMAVIMGVTYMSAKPTLQAAHDLVASETAAYDLSAQAAAVANPTTNIYKR